MPILKGYAIISREGMIAHEDGSFPDVLKCPGDQRFFRAGLRAADVIIHGRHSGEGGIETAERPRLVLTRQVEALAPDAANDRMIRWNPAGASFADAWQLLGLERADAVAAVLGGTDVFDLFLGIGYDAFYLSRADVSVPTGRKVFAGPQTPQAQLHAHGLAIRGCQELDADPRVVLERWYAASYTEEHGGWQAAT